MSVLPFPNFPAPTSVAESVALYVQYTRHQQAPRTYLDRKAILDEFAAHHGTLPLAAAKPYHLRLWIDGHASWKSDWTKLRAARTVLRAFNWCKKVGLTAANPFEGGEPYPTGGRGRPMSDETFRKLLRGSDALFRRVLTFLYFTGARPGEMSALEPKHLVLDPEDRGGFALLEQHKTSRKTRKPRKIYFHPIVCRLIRWQLARMLPGQERLFVNAKGRPWDRNSLGLRVARLRKRLKIDKAEKLYGLRHAYVTRGLINEVPIATMAELAGHASTKTTEVYNHIGTAARHLTQAVLKIFEAG